MKNTAIARAVSIIGREPLRQLLETVFGNMSRQMINKAIKNGYAPSDWYELIEIATDHQVTVNQLFNDCYINKRHCKPKVVRRQAELFSTQCQKCRQLVGKSRQKAA
jgi:hypothetical protein